MSEIFDPTLLLTMEDFLNKVKTNKCQIENDTIKIYEKIMDIGAIKREINTFVFLKNGIKKDIEAISPDCSLDIICNLDKRLMGLRDKSLDIYNMIRKESAISRVRYLTDIKSHEFNIIINSHLWYKDDSYVITEIHNNLESIETYILVESISKHNEIKSFLEKVDLDELQGMIDYICDLSTQYMSKQNNLISLKYIFKQIKSIFKKKKNK